MMMNRTIVRRAFCLKVACSLLLLPQDLTSAAGEQPFVLDKFLKENAGLNNVQIDSIHRGKAVATILDSPTPDQVFVFGTVYIDAMPENYLQLANDFDALRKLPGYLAIHRFSNPPQLSDLREVIIDAEDFKQLKSCKPGDCEVQLPSEAM